MATVGVKGLMMQLSKLHIR